jgi:ribose transport system ATP-binding protein
MTTALSVRDATKIFGGTTALDHVSIDVEPGEVRALVGQNGCGKSTLIKILAGYHQPEPGTSVTVGGQELAFGDGTASEAAGLRFVHQDLGLVANLDAVDNMALGQGYVTNGLKTIRWRKERAAAQLAQVRLHCHVSTIRGLRLLLLNCLALAPLSPTPAADCHAGRQCQHIEEAAAHGGGGKA